MRKRTETGKHKKAKPSLDRADISKCNSVWFDKLTFWNSIQMYTTTYFFVHDVNWQSHYTPTHNIYNHLFERVTLSRTASQVNEVINETISNPIGPVKLINLNSCHKEINNRLDG